eukprot:Skav200322  [mRNA]  locus=scaffold1760:63805:65333:- [translate_table: standard]
MFGFPVHSDAACTLSRSPPPCWSRDTHFAPDSDRVTVRHEDLQNSESKPKVPRIQRGVPKLPESNEVAALRAALGLGRTKQEERSTGHVTELRQLDSEDLAAQPPKLP